MGPLDPGTEGVEVCERHIDEHRCMDPRAATRQQSVEFLEAINDRLQESRDAILEDIERLKDAARED